MAVALTVAFSNSRWLRQLQPQRDATLGGVQSDLSGPPSHLHSASALEGEVCDRMCLIESSTMSAGLCFLSLIPHCIVL